MGYSKYSRRYKYIFGLSFFSYCSKMICYNNYGHVEDDMAYHILHEKLYNCCRHLCILNTPFRHIYQNIHHNDGDYIADHTKGQN